MRHLLDTDYGQFSVDSFYWDDMTDMITQETTFYCDALFDENTQRQNDGTNGFSQDRNFREIASVPLELAPYMLKNYNIDMYNREDDKRMLSWLRDRDNRKFTTVRGGSF